MLPIITGKCTTVIQMVCSFHTFRSGAYAGQTTSPLWGFDHQIGPHSHHAFFSVMGKVESATGWQANMRYSCNSLYLGQAENYLNTKSCFEIEHGTQRYPNRIEDPPDGGFGRKFSPFFWGRFDLYHFRGVSKCRVPLKSNVYPLVN